VPVQGSSTSTARTEFPFDRDKNTRNFCQGEQSEVEKKAQYGEESGKTPQDLSLPLLVCEGTRTAENVAARRGCHPTVLLVTAVYHYSFSMGWLSLFIVLRTPVFIENIKILHHHHKCSRKHFQI